MTDESMVACDVCQGTGRLCRYDDGTYDDGCEDCYRCDGAGSVTLASWERDQQERQRGMEQAEKEETRRRELAAAQTDIEDGFRPRRKRPANWYENAIASGEIADPDNPHVDPEPSPDAFVIRPPLAAIAGTGDEEEE